MPLIIEREPLEVLCLALDNGVDGAAMAWRALRMSHVRAKRLGALIPEPPLDARQRLGCCTHRQNDYRACVPALASDDPVALGLEPWVLPGGTFVQEEILDWQKRVLDIGQTFEDLADQYRWDPSRPNIEIYADDRKLILLFPIVAEGVNP